LENYNQHLSLAGLAPFEGEWTKATAAHLLRRTTFGPTFSEINTVAQAGLSRALSALLQALPPPQPPILHRQETEPVVQVGSTWINAPHPSGGGAFRSQSLKGWYFLNIMQSPTNIREKMVLFWLNYFGISGVVDYRAKYKTIRVFQELAVGNFRAMINRITVDPSMLIFLNGDISDERNPNENFARELLELFTIQKGPQVAPGDYTTYTEQDIVEIARALTGWRNYPFYFSDDDTPIESYFDPAKHDTGTKQLSHRFGNAVISNSGANEYKKVVDIIFLQEETAKAFCREIYRFFVFYEISSETEQEVIVPLANIFRDANYEIQPLLESLFGSKHFYDMSIRGAMIKNPEDFIGSIYRPVGEFSHLIFPSIQVRYEAAVFHNNWSSQLDMDFLSAPTVAGWLAYYQAPNFYRSWISTSTIQRRFDLVLKFMTPLYSVNTFRLPVDWRSFLSSLSNPFSLDAVLSDVIGTFLPREIHPDQVIVLKDSVLQGLEDSEWRDNYVLYVTNPADVGIAITFERRMYQLFTRLFGMPEFQLQ
jgi:uncharacterized protein (DUF1800 family)